MLLPYNYKMNQMVKKIEEDRKLRWIRSLYPFWCVTMLSAAYLAHIVFKIPIWIHIILIPLILGLTASRLFDNLSKIIMILVVILFSSFIVNIISLLTPVIFNVFPDQMLADWFTYLVFYRTFGRTLLIILDTLISALLGIFIWGRW